MGVVISLIVYISYRTEYLDKFYWYLFWVGFFLGLCWELPLSLANEIEIYPPARFMTPVPLSAPFSIFVIAITHSLWDGGLFLLGAWFINLICKKPYFDKFKWSELSILIVFGQVSELIVELVSSLNRGWEYIVYWWNPRLFVFNNHDITLLPQLIWLVAPIVFYFFALKLKMQFPNIQST